MMDRVDFSTNVEVITDENERLCRVNITQKETLVILGVIVICILVVLVAANFIEASDIKELLSVLKGE